MVLMSEVII